MREYKEIQCVLVISTRDNIERNILVVNNHLVNLILVHMVVKPLDSTMEGSGLFRLYFGGLPREVTEADIRSLFKTHDLSAPLTVVIKPAGYAFIECPDQFTFNSAIDTLNGR